MSQKFFTPRRAVALVVGAACSVPSFVVAVRAFFGCGETPCMAFWMFAVPVSLALVAVNLGVGVLVGDAERPTRLAGWLFAVPILLVDVVTWILFTGA